MAYKSAIAFGLVYVPVTLFPCIKNNDIGFNMLYKKTGDRIKYKKTCENCPENISQDETVKGFEYEKDKYITITEKDLEKIKSEKDKSIDIMEFVKLEEIDPIYYDRAFYVVPTGADNAFKLLLKALDEEGKVGVAKTVLGTKESIVALRVIKGQMVLNTLYFYEEVQRNPIKLTDVKVKDGELKLAKDIIKGMTEKFDPKMFKDEYREKLMKAIELKINGEEIKSQHYPKKTNLINIMDALKKTALDLTNSKKTKKKVKEQEQAKEA
ncbi:MAG: Ku protein [Clostridia bacterium]|nr:Ku protein [Clostridia bacterium]